MGGLGEVGCGGVVMPVPPTLAYTALSWISPSRYQVMSAAGLAPEALQVRLCGVWAFSLTTGPPSTTGSAGGTAGRRTGEEGGSRRGRGVTQSLPALPPAARCL